MAFPMVAVDGTLVLAVIADSAILDRSPRWFSLEREVVREHVPNARLVSFFADEKNES